MKLLGKIEQAQDAVSKEYVDGLVESGGSGISQEDFDALFDGLVEAEEVTATALINLHERLNTLSENVAGETVTKTEFKTAISDLSNTILENEEITAFALTNLDSQIKEIITRLNNAGL